MKSIVPLLAMTVLSAFMVAGCDQNTTDNSNNMSSTNSSGLSTNDINSIITNTPSTNNLSDLNTNVPAQTNIADM
jgi:hypothetical protein